MVVAYLVTYGANPSGFAEYARIVARVFGPAALAGLVIKCLAFGAVVAVIPIAAGLDATRERQSVALKLLRFWLTMGCRPRSHVGRAAGSDLVWQRSVRAWRTA